MSSVSPTQVPAKSSNRVRRIVLVLIAIPVSFVVFLIVVFVVYLPWSQNRTNKAIDQHYQTVSIPSYLVRTARDCSLQDVIDVGPQCTYDYDSKNVNRQSVYADITDALKKQGFSTDDPFDDSPMYANDQIDASNEPLKLKLHIEFQPSLFDNSLPEPSTIRSMHILATEL
jgi:hypothetical protein